MWITQLRFSATAASHTAARLAARPAHRSRLTEHHAAGRLIAAGPFADDSGALLLFDIPDRAELDRLLSADPYYSFYSLPGVELVCAREWSPVLSRS